MFAEQLPSVKIAIMGAKWRRGAMSSRHIACFLHIVPAGLLLIGLPASADTLAQLDDLSRISADGGVVLARNQIRAGDLLGAVATLERVLISHPESDEALLLHASLLCRLDDPAGSLIEFDYLRGRNVPERIWAEAVAPCDGDTDRGER